ncbi:phosphoribosylformylglycinamidine synthase subunit PurS [Membranicola marinus]|uniref:Phosphoribosylformylglycinamidine synthase subunit PurS n=1 Tax=Membranihabitans marinus TaxID=1227546 RepID=A0A953LAL4_9BACT|nr:phosphoribosylformylglycinamidine synthase subunit PurS [Membranihabitans marinus]MBY5958828.1 phosphoribosylformylglycinamidine synthase subunit PurS [Membranihabitans marinus]
MKYKAEIKIMPHAELLDPQGKTVGKNLPNIGIHEVDQVRIGKYIEMIVDADSKEEAEKIVDTSCKKLLANLIMEKYEFNIEPLS